MNARAEAVAALERRLGRAFADPALLERALTHASVAGGLTKGRDNEVLEFIGDRVIGLLAAERLAQLYPAAPEGDLAPRLNVIVSREACARVARRIELGPALRLSGAETKTGGRDKDSILAFREEHKDVIVKPLFGNGGAGVFHVKPDDENLGALLETFTLLYREPVIVQRYLPEIRQGDKRIILIEGEARANFHAGGSARATTLTQREQDICAAIGPTLRQQGLVFVGIDVIGDYMTEINVTSPTGIQEINRLDGVQLERILWDAIEGRVGARNAG